ncbi:tRNA (cytidine(34)-2'-O)-methyltransferase [Wolffia australiana]
MEVAGLRALALGFPSARLRPAAIICSPTFPQGARWRPRRSLNLCIRNSQTSPLSDVTITGRQEAPAESSHLLQVVLVSPQIAGNTGCIARTCAASAVGLHLVEPLGYKVDDTKLKRAGLDYWPYVVVKIHSSWNEFMEYFQKQEGDKRLLAFTKRGKDIHSDFNYRTGDWLVFGSETSGLPVEALKDCSEGISGGGTIRIPMVETHVRCLNLSVSVGIALYEASRQLDYAPLHSSAAATDVAPQSLFISEDIYA